MMATNRTIAKSMLMGIVTTVFIGFGFSACTANEDSPTPQRYNMTTQRMRLMA